MVRVVAAVPPKVTCAVLENPTPVMVTVVPPAVRPRFGVIADTVKLGSTVGATVPPQATAARVMAIAHGRRRTLTRMVLTPELFGTLQGTRPCAQAHTGTISRMALRLAAELQSVK
jgi:hypothetical protein